jgi:hypothetical protein
MPDPLNKNNFLRWTGSFNAAVFSNSAVDDVASMPNNAASVDISILLNDISTFGINLSSILVTVQDNISRPATFNPATQKLTYYLPSGSVSGLRTIKYKWADVYGNMSNEATIRITVTARATAWRGQGTPTCVMSGGVRTGYSLYAILEQYYTDDNSATGVTKANVNTDPDYIPQALDPTNCSTATYLTRTLSFNATDSSAPCGSSSHTDYYVAPADSSWRIGMLLWNETSLTTQAATGWYSDGTYLLQVYMGRVINISTCP